MDEFDVFNTTNEQNDDNNEENSSDNIQSTDLAWTLDDVNNRSKRSFFCVALQSIRCRI